MKRMLVLLLMLMLRESLYAQPYVGLENNKYAFVGYKWNSGWNVKFTHSIFDENFKYQYVRCTGEYQFCLECFDFVVFSFAGKTYCGSFCDLAIGLEGHYYPLSRLGIDTKLMPTYDSGYGYETCYMLGIKFLISDEIILQSCYSTIPEYRISEKRIKAGLQFQVNALKVVPMLSMPIKSNAKALRVLVGFQYEFLVGKSQSNNRKIKC